MQATSISSYAPAQPSPGQLLPKLGSAARPNSTVVPSTIGTVPVGPHGSLARRQIYICPNSTSYLRFWENSTSYIMFPFSFVRDGLLDYQINVAITVVHSDPGRFPWIRCHRQLGFLRLRVVIVCLVLSMRENVVPNLASTLFLSRAAQPGTPSQQSSS